jgi:hypothetical protein
LLITVDAIPEADTLVLRMRYDDGFVAYLNGTEVARTGAPDELSWDATATRSRTNRQVTTREDIVLSAVPNALRIGENLLAFHVLNRSLSGPDLLLAPELIARKRAAARAELTETTLIRSRILFDGEWSALAERLFSRSTGLRVSEVHYHPADDADLEFVELTNVAAETRDLSGVRFTAGVEYEFPNGTILAPGAVLVLARDSASLTARYGNLPALAGEYEGTLDNAGDAIRITGPLEEVIVDFAYKDHWYPGTDGGGRSLVAVEPAASGDAFFLRESWTPSAGAGGSPGELTSPGVTPRGLQRLGDANQDTHLDITDALKLIRIVVGDPDVVAPCTETDATAGGNAALNYVNGDDTLNLTDALHLLNHVFQRGRAPVGGAGCVRIAGCEDVCLR